MRIVLRWLLLPAAILLMGIACTEAGPLAGSNPSESDGPLIVNASSYAAEGEIILKLKSGAAATVTKAGLPGDRSGIDRIDRVLNTIGTIRFERLFPECGRFEARTAAEGLDRWFIAKYDPQVPVDNVASLLSECNEIEVIEYSLNPKIAGYSKVAAPQEEQFAKASGTSRNAPFPFNESQRTRTLQWHYNNPGTVGPVSTLVGADANVYAAWQLCQGNPDVIVAVIDEGVKYDHEDLAENMWTNTGEIPGNGIDDDGNGYVDDIYGYNFINGSGEIVTSAEQMHGTHVAGTIAAVNNNGIGVNGIAGGSGNGDGVRIMSLQCISDSRSSSSGSSGLGGVVRAMKYAADNGAVICQNSWGYTAGAIKEIDWNRGVYSAVSEAVRYFVKYAGIDEDGNQTGPMAGGIVIFAAGNDGSDVVCYPASDPNVVSVASISYLGTPAAYTNHGPWVSMAAPGGDLTLNTVYGGVYSTSVAEDGSSYYESIQGTSMACPHVSGACALAVSYYYGPEKRKGLTSETLRQALLSSTRPADSWYPSEYSGQMGAGILDTYNLLLTVTGMADIPAQRLGVGQRLVLDLGEYFPSVKVLSYSVSVPGIVEISLKAGVMTITGLSGGTTAVTVADGTAIRKTIDITVE